jgi:radical SAM protein with 4Fe4S-binding SPASM domain
LKAEKLSQEDLKAICNAVRIVGSDTDNFPNFLEWFFNRWQPGAELQRIDPDSPWSPDNAYLEGGIELDGWTEKWSEAYRKAKTPRQDPCLKCRTADYCTQICPAKAKYWDKTRNKLKRMMNDVHGKRD